MVAGCCSDAGEVRIVPGPGITLEGSGSPTNPFKIGTEQPDFTRSIRVKDSPTLNLTMLGSGTPEDPFVIHGSAEQRIDGATDFRDPQGPAQGDTLVYVGTGDDGHWEAAPPPPSPPGAISVSGGLTGSGAAGDPIKVRTSGTADGDGLDGAEIYVDVTGALRARGVAGGGGDASGSVAWGNVGGKPSTFTPSAHKHTAADISDPQNINAGKVNGIIVYAQQSQPPVGPAGTLWARW